MTSHAAVCWAVSLMDTYWSDKVFQRIIHNVTKSIASLCQFQTFLMAGVWKGSTYEWSADSERRTFKSHIL